MGRRIVDSQELTAVFETYLRGVMAVHDQVTVSPARTTEDWEVVRALRQSFGGNALSSKDLDEGDFKGVVYIARIEGVAVGTARVIHSRDTALPELIRSPWREPLLLPNSDYVELGRLVVHPNHRTFMVSAALIRAVLVYIVESGAQGLFLTCLDSLVNYYGRMGFRLVDKDDREPSGPRNFMVLDDAESPMFSVITSLTRAMMTVFGSTFRIPAPAYPAQTP